jgi:hypothetical protein
VPAFEIVMRRTNRPDRVRYHRGPDRQIGDVVEIDGKPWIIIDKEPAPERRLIERIICVPRKVQNMH